MAMSRTRKTLLIITSILLVSCFSGSRRVRGSGGRISAEGPQLSETTAYSRSGLPDRCRIMFLTTL